MSHVAPDAEHRPSLPGLELQARIGEGGPSVVYRALHLALQRGVAVKILRADADLSWLRESRLMAALAHPHVVAIHDAGQAEGRGYLVLEYMAGGSLRARMTPGKPWPLADAAIVLDRIGAALEHVHGRGVLHLDLKPENVLFADDGQVKVSDFGLSAPHDDPAALHAGRPFGGTIDYAAPEQRSGLPPDARYDVFSYATLAYELLTGRLPGRVYVPASRRNPRLPKALDDVLRRGLARNPEERYASAAAFRRALADACRTPSRPARWLKGAAALAALAGLVFLGYRWATAPTPAPPPRMWVLHDNPDDLALFLGLDGAERVAGATLPPELALPVSPTPRPALVLRSPGAWGFVHPLLDATLGRRVAKRWPAPALARGAVNHVQAGGFDGDCLAPDHHGKFWRAGGSEGWDANRRIAVDRPADRPDDPSLLLSNPKSGAAILGCYQALNSLPAPGSVVALRYRARAEGGNANLAVYPRMAVVVPAADDGPAARRTRAVSPESPPDANDPVPDRRDYRSRAWVTPTEQWQTFVTVFESPPFASRALHRNLVIDVTAGGRVRVDDIELFDWQPGGEP